MGKGDKKSRKGKIARGTYGVRRPRKTDKNLMPTTKPKAKVKETEIIVLEEKKVKTEKAAKPVNKEKPTEKKAGAKKTPKKEE